MGTTSVDLSKPSNVAKNDAVKKTEYDELVKKVNTVQTTDTSDLIIAMSILIHKNLIS